jgi:hypothetical protein
MKGRERERERERDIWDFSLFFSFWNNYFPFIQFIYIALLRRNANNMMITTV